MNNHNNTAFCTKPTRTDPLGLHGNGLSFHRFAEIIGIIYYLGNWRGTFSSYCGTLYQWGETFILLHKKYVWMSRRIC